MEKTSHLVFAAALSKYSKRDKIIWKKKSTEKFGFAKAEVFRTKLLSVSRELSIDSNYIIACITLKTGKTFRNDIKTPGLQLPA